MKTNLKTKNRTLRALLLGLMSVALLVTANQASAQQRKQKPQGATMINDAQPSLQGGQTTPRMNSMPRNESQFGQNGNQKRAQAMAAVIEPEAAVVPQTQWALLTNGWFDYEGLNLDYIPNNSPLLRANSRWDRRGQTYRLEPGDVIAAIDGQPVTNYQDYLYALNYAANPRNLSIQVINWRDGSTLNLWVSAQKIR